MSKRLSKLRDLGELARQGGNVYSSARPSIRATSAVFNSAGQAVARDTFTVQRPSPVPLCQPQPAPQPLPTAQPDANVAEPTPGDLPTETLPNNTPPPEDPLPQVFQDFEDLKAAIANILFEHHTADGLGDLCSCGSPNATKTVTCRECRDYGAKCPECFTLDHVHLPTHWAHVWSPERGFFVRHDISALPGTPRIHLGHGGSPCPSFGTSRPSAETFTIVDVNGIHSTKVEFCSCGSGGERYEQLLRARLFPGTFRRPRLAFTLATLRNFEVHHLTSAEPAYEFIAALRHLTDGFFFQDAADPYDQFRDAFKMYRILMAEMRLGQFHGIDKFFPGRPPGNLAILCPACIEFGVNTTQAERDLCDPCLRHLYQLLSTGDGNFQANHYIKHNDPKMISLFRGRAYFPFDPMYQLLLRRVKKDAPGTEQKTTCSHLNAVNKQEKKKFIGTDISGILNVQCPHVFISATVDLQYGERFLNTDYARRHALLLRGLPNADDLKNLSGLFSYDIGCHYEIHVNERFQREELSDVAPLIEKFEYCVPLVHVSNHKDNCVYLYSSAYKTSAGRFHGETAEQPWVYLNSFGGQGRQMSPGNRHDMYIGVETFWNLMKLIKLNAQLFNDLMRAAENKERKLRIFLDHCTSYAELVPEWNNLSRDSRTKKGKEVLCVYRQTPSKLPSQSRIYQALVNAAEGKGKGKKTRATTLESPSESESGESSEAELDEPSILPKQPMNGDPKSLPLLLKHSITIRNLQQRIRSTRQAYKLHESSTIATKLSERRKSLNTALKRLRDLQATVTPQVVKDVNKVKPKLVNETPEDLPLFLPSDYTEAERTAKNLTSLGTTEYKILEGAAYDTLAKLRTIVQLRSSMRARSKKNDYGQTRHTRSTLQMIEANVDFEACLAHYNALRTALISLGLPEDDRTFKKMTESDTFRKLTTETRQTGDAYKSDGCLWTAGAINSHQRLTYNPLINSQNSSEVDMVGTQSSQGLKRKNLLTKKHQDESASKKPRIEPVKGQDTPAPKADDIADVPEVEPKERGWLWDVKSSTKGVSDADVEAFLNEGDRVQWFRAEADMTRWQEEWERKIIEFLRTMRSLDRWTHAWQSLARSPGTSPGKAAAAMKTAMRFRELGRRCESVFQQAGYVYQRSDIASPAASATTQQSTCLDVGPSATEHMATDTDNLLPGAAGPLPPQILTDATVIPFIQAARRTLNETITTTVHDARTKLTKGRS